MYTKSKQCVMVVDDHADLLEFIADDLMDTYVVLTAKNGQQALEVLQTNDVHAIICDLMMPAMDGYMLCKILKDDARYRHIPLLMLTANNQLQAKIDLLELGADSYIEKPFSPAYLRAQLKSLLHNRQLIKEQQSDSLVMIGEEENFMFKLQQLIEDHLQDPALCVELLAEKMYMSRPTLYRKIKHVTRTSPNGLINNMRMKKASELLKTHRYKVYEISGLVGFNSVSQFIRSFQKHFGVTPKEWEQKFLV